MAVPQAEESGPARFGRVAAVVNPSSGGVDSRAVERLRAILAAHDLDCEPRVAQGGGVVAALDEALAGRPDTLIVLAGDGTLCCAAERCAPGGPRLLALPGGTMNMLAFALNGRRPWAETLETVLRAGRPIEVSGGVVGGRPFYVNAILGAPTLLATAREAMRAGKLRLAWLRVSHALSRAFKSRLRFTLDGGPRGKAGALSLICPLVSRGLDEDVGLEAAVLDPRDALQVFRLGVGALFGAWRQDPSVRVQVATRAEVWARGRIPAVLDGEPHRLESLVQIVFRRAAFRAWALPEAAGHAGAAEVGGASRRHQPEAAGAEG